MTVLAEKLNLSQNFAGVTLLAFGNGSSDVIAGLVGSGSSSDGIVFSLSTLIGSGVTVIVFVFSMVVFFAETVKVNE